VQWPSAPTCPEHGLDQFQFRGGPLWAGVDSKRSGEFFRNTDLARGPGNRQVCPLSARVNVVKFGSGHEFAQISSADANPEGAPAEGATTSQVESVRFALSCHIG